MVHARSPSFEEFEESLKLIQQSKEQFSSVSKTEKEKLQNEFDAGKGFGKRGYYYLEQERLIKDFDEAKKQSKQ